MASLVQSSFVRTNRTLLPALVAISLSGCLDADFDFRIQNYTSKDVHVEVRILDADKIIWERAVGVPAGETVKRHFQHDHGVFTFQVTVGNRTVEYTTSVGNSTAFADIDVYDDSIEIGFADAH